MTAQFAPSPPQAARPASPGWRACAGRWAPALLLGLLALGLRLAFLGKDSLWADEFYTWLSATQPTAAAVVDSVARIESVRPAYFVLTHWFLQWAGSSGDIALRLPSALAGAAAPPLMYFLALALFTSRRGLALLAGLLLAISPMHVWYSQEARPYALLVLLELLTLWALAWGLRRAEEPQRARSAAAALTAAALLAIASLQVHDFFLFVWAAVAGTLAWAGWRRLIARGFAAALLALMGAGALWPALASLGRLQSRQHVSWLPERYGPELLLNVARAQFLGPFVSPYPYWLQLAGIGAGLALLGLGVAALVRARRGNPLAGVIMGLGLLSTLAAPVLISFFRPIIFYGQRYLIIAVPLTVLAVAAGLALRRRPAKALAGTLLAGLVLLQLGYLGHHYAYRQKHTWDTLAQRLRQTARPGETIYVLPGRAAGLLGRYLGPGHQIVGVDNLAPVLQAEQAGAGRVFFVCYRDLRGALQEGGLKGPLPTTVFEIRRPGQELWLSELPAQ